MRAGIKWCGAGVLLAVLVAWTAFADPRPGYYAPAEGLEGADLLGALHQVISAGTTNIPYSSSRFDTSDALKWIDENPADTNQVVLIYTGRTALKSAFGTSTGWNREHCWPNSYGLDDVEPSFSDLHNLRAIDANVNSSRGNKIYDESSAQDGGITKPAHAEAPESSADSDSWQPADFHVGDVARSALYMATRYRGTRVSEPALFLTDDPSEAVATTNLMGRLSTLLYWHALDPVDDTERRRNDRVEALQGNRNPFVDRPEFVSAIWGDVTLISATNSNGTVTISWPSPLRRGVLEAADDPSGPWRTAVTNTFSMSELKEAVFFRLRLK